VSFVIEFYLKNIKNEEDYFIGGSIDLEIYDTKQLYSIVDHEPDDYEYALGYDLSEQQFEKIKQYMSSPHELDHSKYEYCLSSVRSHELAEKEEKEFKDSLPEPKSVLALDVIEKERKVGFGVMPLFQVDVDIVRQHFNLPNPGNFEFEDRVDHEFLDFIRTMQSCPNIDLDKYDYRPAIWANVFEQEKEGMNIIDCG